MSLDPTARESNVRDSIKKYFVDNLYQTEKIELSFDKDLSTPRVQGTEVNRWVMVSFGELMLDTMSYQALEIYCCTKQDSEGFRLTQLRDTVMGYLLDVSQTDTMARIPLYRSHPTEAWVQVGTMLVQIESESPAMEAEDGTKFKIIPVLLRWAAIC